MHVVDNDVLTVQVEAHKLSPAVGEALLDEPLGGVRGRYVDKAGVSSFGDNIAKGNWSAASSNIGSYAEATVVRSAISAGVNTAVYGGSFGQAFAGGLVKDAAAVAANGIGGSEHTPEGSLSNVLSHALLGCAAQSLGGGDCAGGAIGGASSAIVAPLVGGALGIQTDADRADPMNQTVVTAVAMLAGSGLAAALGQSATAAAGAAQNEALNNYLSPKDRLAFEKAKRECANRVLSSCAAANIYAERDKKSNGILADGLTKCEGSSCQSLANWIQDQKTSLGCGAASSADCQVLDKSWQIAQAKAQGLELPTFSPDDLIGTGLVKRLLAGTLKGVGLLGMTRSVGNDVTTLYRAVGPAELADIQATGGLRNLGSAEGKYFTTSSSAASDYARQAVSAFGDPAYTTVTTQIPIGILRGIESVTVDGGIPAYVIPNNLLPKLTPSIGGSMALPGK